MMLPLCMFLSFFYSENQLQNSSESLWAAYNDNLHTLSPFLRIGKGSDLQ